MPFIDHSSFAGVLTLIERNLIAEQCVLTRWDLLGSHNWKLQRKKTYCKAFDADGIAVCLVAGFDKRVAVQWENLL